MPGRRRRTTTNGRSAGSKRPGAAAPRRRTPSKPAAETPVAGPGERVWVLAIPFRAPAPGAVWKPSDYPADTNRSSDPRELHIRFARAEVTIGP